MKMKKLTERERFEKWAKRTFEMSVIERTGGLYVWFPLCDMWCAWQASARVKRSRTKSSESR